MAERLKNFIGGRWVEADAGETYDVHNPATGELLAWLQTLAIATGSRPDVLNADVKDLPYLGTLIKHPEDLAALRK